ncbi:hypothetical protein B0I71DRAFT_26938 [Yarrowia lipolytica]|uniref:Uncharacterized protein n=1 Tax=Yarrowia lipolytica TaxID=4952 RepID=A0A371BWT6_YARLL|nr:hypothetical protein B0I71DRAFT_26938 [Yarrowia lipolytica]
MAVSVSPFVQTMLVFGQCPVDSCVCLSLVALFGAHRTYAPSSTVLKQRNDVYTSEFDLYRSIPRIYNTSDPHWRHFRRCHSDISRQGWQTSGE